VFFLQDHTLTDKATGDELLILRFYKRFIRAGVTTSIEHSRERLSLACDLFLVGAKPVFALYTWAITRIAPTQDTGKCKLP
jgi:hypothetical protein